MPHRRPPRLPTLDYRGAYRYFVTCCAAGRRRVFVEDRRLTLLELWQDGYYEQVLRHDEATPAVIAYILGNPVRAGLVESATDYPFGWTIDLDACQGAWI